MDPVEIKIEPLGADADAPTAQAALSLLCDVFVAGSSLHAALGLEAADYQHYLRPLFAAELEQELSLVARSEADGRVMGCLLACDYTKQAAHPQPPEQLQPLRALLAELEKRYRQHRDPQPGQALLVDMAAVATDASGQGVYQALRLAAHERGRAAGFRYAVGELSSSATQHVCVERLGQQVIAELRFDNFEYAGTFPFANISAPATLQLVEAVL